LIYSFSRWRAVFAVAVGNTLEWFDFVIFGYFATIIAGNFFPARSEEASLLLTLLTFGVAFFVRPIGAVLLGHYGDRHGRKPALILTISLMMAGTAIISLTPSFFAIGILAPILIVGGRLLQGLSAGGEFGGATAYLAEMSPERRGFFASWQFAGQAFAAVLATLFGVMLTATLNEEQLTSWGWRLAFLFGLLIGPVAYFIRRTVDESPAFQAIHPDALIIRQVVWRSRERFVFALGAVVLATVGAYTLVFMPSYAAQHLDLPLSYGFMAALLASGLQVILIPVAGALSDRWGRVRIAGSAAAGLLVLTFPLFAWLASAPTPAKLITVQVILGSLVAIYAGALPAFMSELFPTQIRTTGLSISYALSVSIFGGLAPFINASLIELTGSTTAPAFYLMAAAAVTLLSFLAGRRLQNSL
jgi:MHS family proline/betaine transporter-like MFS transporter